MQITKEHLQFLDSKGIIFSVSGRYDLNVDQVLKFIEHPDLAYADIQGVSVEKYRIWDVARQSSCSALTKKKRRCKGTPRAFRSFYGLGPKEYEPGYHDLCPFHGGPTQEDCYKTL